MIKLLALKAQRTAKLLLTLMLQQKIEESRHMNSLRSSLKQQLMGRISWTVEGRSKWRLKA